MSKNTEAQDEQPEEIRAYLRRGDGDGSMVATFEFMKTNCYLFVDPETGAVALHRRLKDDEVGAEIGTGMMARNKEAANKQPNVKGLFKTKKHTRFEVSGWDHKDEVMEEDYIALRIRPHLQRTGKSI